MCGIAGLHRFRSLRPVEAGELAVMAASLRHRGPDDEGVFADGELGLAHRRLSVLDPSPRGHQPMATADGSVVVTYNGEIYNYLELRGELEGRGHRFSTGTDTEVLLALWRERGEEMLAALNGMFAFALWDRRRRALFLARDRLGIKPLYLAHTREGLAFASEVRTLLPWLDGPPAVEVEALPAFLAVGYVPGPDTLFRGVEKLPPGSWLEVEAGRVTERRWWDPAPRPDEGLRWEEAVEETRALLRDAVRLQLRSDVPLGVFLSGGVDSSAVVATMRALGVERVRTFTAAYDFGRGFDETAPARRVAERFATDHEVVWVTPADFVAGVAPMVASMEEPVAEAPAISLAAVARRARSSVVVALSGEGADEVFGGYPIYGHMLALERYRRLPILARRPLDALLGSLGPKWRKYVGWSRLPLEERYLGVSSGDPAALEGLLAPGLVEVVARRPLAGRLAGVYARAGETDPVARMAYLDRETWLPDDLLIKADKMTMASSLELRVPFLDHRLVELGGRLPSRFRVRGRTTKRLLKRAVEPYLPRDIVHRGKMGFPVPLAALFRGELGAYAEDVLGGERAAARGYFRPEVVRRRLAAHRRGEADHHPTLWQLLVLEEWHRAFIDRPA